MPEIRNPVRNIYLVHIYRNKSACKHQINGYQPFFFQIVSLKFFLVSLWKYGVHWCAFHMCFPCIMCCYSIVAWKTYIYSIKYFMFLFTHGKYFEYITHTAVIFVHISVKLHILLLFFTAIFVLVPAYHMYKCIKYTFPSQIFDFFRENLLP